MTIARAQLVDTSVARWYHCVSRRVRRAFLLGEEPHDRKGWIEARLEELSQRRVAVVGHFFAASRARLQQVAARLGVRRVGNLAGCPAQ